jgi:tetratricopeptide (TPR) repeat protein
MNKAQSSNQPFTKSITEALRALSLGQLSSAAGHLAEAREAAQHCVDYARVLDTFGALLSQKQDFKQALEHHLQAAKLCREAIDDWDGLVLPLAQPPDLSVASSYPISEARYLANVGALAQISDKPAIAESALARAFWLLDQNPDPKSDPLLAEVAHNLGVFLMNVGKTEDSIPFLERSLRLDQASLKEQANPLFRQSVHSDLLRLSGALRRNQKPEHHERALEVVKQSLELADSIDATARASSLLELGALYFASGDLPLAMDQTRQAIDALEESQALQNHGAIALQLGRAYVDLALYARRLGRKAAATQSLNRATEQANIARSPALTAMIARERAQLSS